MAENKDNVLVTGCCGFIGSHICDVLLANNYNVVGIDDLSGGTLANLNKDVIFIRTDLHDPAMLDTLFLKYRFRFVYHFAAYAAEGLSHYIRSFNYSNNLLTSSNLINAALSSRGVECFVFASSIAVYGTSIPPYDENIQPKPEDPYGIAKYAVELDLSAAKSLFGLNYIIFRPHNVYGERQNIWDPFRNVIGIFLRALKSGEPMPVFGDGRQSRAFTYIGDIVKVIALSVQRPGAYNRIFNIGAATPYTVLEVGQALARLYGVSPSFKFNPQRHEVTHAYSSHKSLLSEFSSLYSETSLEEGLSRTILWVKHEPTSKETVRFKVEVDLNIPQTWRNYIMLKSKASAAN